MNQARSSATATALHSGWTLHALNAVAITTSCSSIQPIKNQPWKDTIMGSERRIMYGLGLFLLLAVGPTSAQDLPNLSLLKRYGVPEDQLPAAPADLALNIEPTKSRFEIKPERPLIRVEKTATLCLKPPATSALITRRPKARCSVPVHSQSCSGEGRSTHCRVGTGSRSAQRCGPRNNRA